MVARKGLSSSSWLEHWLPEAAMPYAKLARLDKPIGTWLIVWPCFWSIAIATRKGEIPDLKMLALFGCGSVILRGLGCTVNDLFDRDIDKKVERTKKRPLASGALTPLQGLYFLVFQVLLWFGFLLQLNNYSIILGASFLVPVFTYPLMKRVTYWPQAYLGLAINCGVALGWSAIKEDLDSAIILPLYTAAICWTLVYDTIYAHQDKEDDIKVGVKSTALLFGDMTKYCISAFGVACIGSLALSGYNAYLAWSYYPFLIASAAQLAWQITAVNLSSRSDCNKMFVSNKWFGALIFGGILSGVVLP
nr:4-hydroxybenzoate polyprenyltransferase, mitochondrial-like [Setaria viridis]